MIFLNLGTLELCSKAADLLTQKQNNDIESDYEKENSRSKDTAPDTSGTLSFLMSTKVLLFLFFRNKNVYYS
jgi:hypothetical protein